MRITQTIEHKYVRYFILNQRSILDARNPFNLLHLYFCKIKKYISLNRLIVWCQPTKQTSAKEVEYYNNILKTSMKTCKIDLSSANSSFQSSSYLQQFCAVVSNFDNCSCNHPYCSVCSIGVNYPLPRYIFSLNIIFTSCQTSAVEVTR